MPEKILIVRMSAMGDVVQTTPVARGLKIARPASHITWFVQAPFAPLLAHNPHIDELIVLPARPRPADLLEAWWRLKAAQFDITVDVQGLLKSAFVTWTSAAPRRIGKEEAREAARFAYTELSPERWDQRYISQRYLEQCQSLGVSRDDFRPELFLIPDDFALVDEVYATEGLDASAPVVVLVPFSAGPRKEWPPDYVVCLAELLTDRLGARIIIPGSAPERERAQALADRISRPPTVLAGRTSMREAAAFLQRADLVIGVESGLTHMAYALGTPVVCIHGCGPLRNTPVGPFTRAVYIEDIPCRPCRPSTPCAHRRCLLELTPEMVWAAVEDLAAEVGLR
ncbi:MAG: glycosyltransferase family 9 protein [Armatimonadota bacterium]